MRKLLAGLLLLVCSCIHPVRYQVVGFYMDPGGDYWQPTANGLMLIDTPPVFYLKILVDGRVRLYCVDEETYGGAERGDWITVK